MFPARAWAILAVGLAVSASVSTNVSASPPPPSDPQSVRSVQAIDELEPFVGVWRDQIELPTPDGQYHETVYRDLVRMGDVILFTAGVQNGAREVNAIAYNPSTNEYRLHLPGYRHTLAAKSDEVVSLRHPNKNTIQWEIPYPAPPSSPDHVKIRMTVTVESGRWHEKMEKISGDGRAATMSEFSLKRAER